MPMRMLEDWARKVSYGVWVPEVTRWGKWYEVSTAGRLGGGEREEDATGDPGSGEWSAEEERKRWKTL